MTKLMGYVIVTMLVFFLLVLSLGTVGRLLPYEPLVVNTYDFRESQACPGDLIDLDTDRYVDDSYHVETIHIESYWQKMDDPRPYLPYSYDLDDDELSNTEASALRLAPFTSGEWQIRTEFTIDGSVLYFVPRTQKLDLITDSMLVVQECETTDRS